MFILLRELHAVTVRNDCIGECHGLLPHPISNDMEYYFCHCKYLFEGVVRLCILENSFVNIPAVEETI